MNLTKPDKTQPPELTPEQLHAVSLLAAGQTDADVAQAVGKSRQTVWGWKRFHPRFRAELNRQLADLQTAAAARLKALRDKALARLDAALDAAEPTNWKLPLALLQSLPADHAPVGPTDPAEFVEAEAQRCKETDIDRMLSESEGSAITNGDRTAALAALLAKAGG